MLNRIRNKVVLPSLLTASFIGVNTLAIQPAKADEHLLRDVGIGAAAGVLTGVITHRSPVASAINGAAAGAAVSGANDVFGSHPGHRDIARDAVAGAAGSSAIGQLTGRRHALNNAIEGAAAGAAINLINHRHR